MKIVVERDRLKDALRLVVNLTKGNNIPILSHVLMEAKDSTLRIVGHNLDSCSQIIIPAEVSAPGSIVLPCDRLSSLVVGLATGSQVRIDADALLAKMRCGRSSYEFSTLPIGDFPDMLEPKDAVTFTLTAQQIRSLFETPAACVAKDLNRPYISGIYLHKRGKAVRACATDGHTLAWIAIDAKTPDFEGVIIPANSCIEFLRVAGDDEAIVEVSRALASIESGGRRFVTKLIDGTFPDYEKVVPPRGTPTMKIDCTELDAALARIVAAADAETHGDVIKLSWSDNPDTITASLRSQGASGDEEISCLADHRKAGEIGLQCHYLRRLIEVTGGESIRLCIGDPGSPIRIENPATDDMVGVCMPCRV